MPLEIPHIKIDAFNLVEGSAFVDDMNRVWVVMELADFYHAEQIFVLVRRGDTDFDTEDPFVKPIIFDYCQKVSLIGIVRNPKDHDDNNWGNS